MKVIDLRSDTVTRPTDDMLEVMMSAQVGDDVFDEDPTIKALEEKCAAQFGMEAGLFCPSGTMANQIGLKALTNPYEEIICYQGAHIYRYEGGGIAGNSGLSMRLLPGDRGRLSLNDILDNINPDDIHAPPTTVIALENTVNKGGGSYYTLDQIAEIGEAAKSRGIKMHLDGARVFNALVETGEDPKEYGKHFDSISVCLSKGLGAPVGSVLMGTTSFQKKAKRIRKYMGGGMRQAGYLAAAGIYALDHHFDRLKEDHQRAKVLGDTLTTLSYAAEVKPVDTNIVIFKLVDGITTDKFLDKLNEHGVKAVPFGKGEIRFVTHLDFDDDMLDDTVKILRKLSF